MGLSNYEVITARSKYGANSLSFKKENGFVDVLRGLVKEPMVILLLVTSCIYFISGQPGDGIFLAPAIVLVAGIGSVSTRLLLINNLVINGNKNTPH
ncbi:cation-transporting P-type ATPase [Mucilaginibacter sp. OK268]|uniref:cation-transporting P-type ATPase n=1 Tax=Mucilaginibacter sp. OK268 TaxID=1881048 RepID=UPI000B89A3AB|nr:cation-transporting P-type ATPase [Mucilaginibacter sp. OK268]